MSVLSPSSLRACYAFLRECPPFSAWKLPQPEFVVFKVARTKQLRGWYVYHRGGHTINISAGTISHTSHLVMTMAHEMIHLHLKQSGGDRGGEHNSTFNRLARRVCAEHGWDPMLF